MSFELRNKIMVLVSDDLTAYGIAQDFIKDDQQKFTVFERCYNAPSSANQPNNKASLAKDKATELWKVYEEPESV